jgi:pimeloyl-ACP methyl ester carboxylesterase
VDIQTDFESRHLDSKYGRLHYVRHKAGNQAVILLHGFAGSLRSWARLVQHLPDGLTVYALDLMGHGDSEAPAHLDYSLRMHYETVRELVAEQGLRSYCLFGHSYGGWIAAHYAIQEDIMGLVLEDSAGLKDLADEWYQDNPNYKEEMVRKALALNPREDVLRKMLDADNTEELLIPGTLNSIESRTLIMWGGNDTTINVKYARVFNRAIRGSRLVVLEGERHTPHYTNPEEVARVLTEFLKDRA